MQEMRREELKLQLGPCSHSPRTKQKARMRRCWNYLGSVGAACNALLIPQGSPRCIVLLQDAGHVPSNPSVIRDEGHLQAQWSCRIVYLIDCSGFTYALEVKRR